MPETPVRVQFLGSGDAFGSGGRLQSCFRVQHAAGSFLVDCGASAMTSLRRFCVEPNSIDAILVTHLHGDHFGGLPFFILDAQLVSRRTGPLILAGPPGFSTRLPAAMECLFPGSWAVKRKFGIDCRDMRTGETFSFGPVRVTPSMGLHPSGDTAHSLRVEVDGRVLAFSGDTQWTDALAETARSADLFVAESYYFDKRIPYHLDYRTLSENTAGLGIRRIILTHMSADMLSRTAEAGFEAAEDGLTVEV